MSNLRWEGLVRVPSSPASRREFGNGRYPEGRRLRRKARQGGCCGNRCSTLPPLLPSCQAGSRLMDWVSVCNCRLCHCAGVFCALLAEMTSQAWHSKRAVKSILYETKGERIPGIPKYEFLQALRIPYEKNLQNLVCFKDSIVCLQIIL